MSPQQFIQQRLAQRQHKGNYRQLKTENNLIDFSSNDYLGFARSVDLKELVNQELLNHPHHFNGSTGSRLLKGNTAYAEELESYIAQYHNTEAALLFNSGYDANLGLLSSLPQRGDTVIHDELAHASIIDGIRLSYANRYSFKHNNLNELETKLKQAKGNCYIVVESVYSMDGDIAPLTELCILASQYNAALVVDEAHAIGVFGKGLVDKLNLQEEIFARIITYGKAMGCHGAAILGSKKLSDYLINFARSFIYTTASPFHQLATIKMAYKLLNSASEHINNLQANITHFNAQMGTHAAAYSSAIKTIIVNGNLRTKRAAAHLQNTGLDVRPILSPTVAVGTERLRICLHSYNTPAQIDALVNALKYLDNNE
ncbi:aminotransferase class I/II-fold pyridoxal phosphate-dependent enzyme [Mucilaginibacter terrae]|uniref:8-amino-7-oxononanoate synthase n=1 Tax=Mucilaginibacter terrae TaxID=1955052 RepID=A0ABU3GZN2_9SPHI|nr:8-amino-7-oxononanoate synthase [Mucilaginibacter terrae]MDT3405229.1 8-amino-7-oxononanoate synthase [Mucilaginibacter terrae]